MDNIGTGRSGAEWKRNCVQEDLLNWLKRFPSGWEQSPESTARKSQASEERSTNLEKIF